MIGAIVALGVTQSAVAALVMTDLDHHLSKVRYKTDRNVIIRTVDWSRNIMPLQIFSGKALAMTAPPSEQCNDRIGQERAAASVTRPWISNESQQKRFQKQGDISETQAFGRLESKLRAEARASRELIPEQHLHILYRDAHICVVHKPSGVLSVPGPRRNPSVANLIHDIFQPPNVSVDQLVVHRLDMDTSGVVVYALSELALKQLHKDFRRSDHENNRVKKTYEALVCGHVATWEGEIDLPLERDPNRPPFMRVSLGAHANYKQQVGEQYEVSTFGAFAKHIRKAPKPSLTEFRVLSRHVIFGKYPVTRLELTPHTGRTHQLRVHCAAIGHAILGDDIYGIGGEGSLDGGLLSSQMALFPDRASLSLQQSLARDFPTNLCLHAKQLCIYHPFNGSPMMFEAQPNF